MCQGGRGRRVVRTGERWMGGGVEGGVKSLFQREIRGKARRGGRGERESFLFFDEKFAKSPALAERRLGLSFSFFSVPVTWGNPPRTREMGRVRRN